MAASDDLYAMTKKVIDDRISSYMTTLLAADSARHDRLCGQIMGLNEALKALTENLKATRLRDFDPDDEKPALPSARRFA